MLTFFLMKIESIRLENYSKRHYLEAFVRLRDDGKNKEHHAYADPRVQEIIDTMRYFMQKYILPVETALNLEKILEHIRKTRPNDYLEIGLIVEILEHFRGDEIHSRLFAANY